MAQARKRRQQTTPHGPHNRPSSSRNRHPRQGFSLLDGLIAVMAVAVLGVFLYPWLNNHAGEQRATCAEHTRQLSLAMLQYAQDYDMRYPRIVMFKSPSKRHARVGKAQGAAPAKPQPVTISISDEPVAFGPGQASYGWADALFLYIRDPRIYHCPAIARAGQTDPTQSGYTDYWYNRNLDSLPITSIPRPANTLLLGEGNDGGDFTDARYSLSSLPPEWPVSVHAPPFRHDGGAFYAFADGHAQWLTPGHITSENGGEATFSLQ